ncbi:MAG: hypothetical protein ABSB74_18335 [Tepidisphaeraceae bacterium]
MLVGCSGQSQSPPKIVSPPPPIVSGDASPTASEAGAPQTTTGVITCQMYQLQMPFGANSRDEAFWKLVDEDVMDVPTSILMNNNGLRIGRARVADWPTFLKILERESAIKIAEHRISAQPAVGDARLDMSEELPEELLYIYDQHGLTMRSYDDCQNRMSLAFQWAPRKPMSIRLTMCPMVIAWRTRFDYALSDEPPPTKYLQRDNFYDLHFCADISPGEFLVVGTSTATQDPNRLGSRFLTRDGPNQRYEELLILVGKPVAMNGMKTGIPKPTTRVDSGRSVKPG